VKGDTAAPPEDEDVNLHFVAFVHRDGRHVRACGHDRVEAAVDSSKMDAVAGSLLGCVSCQSKAPAKRHGAVQNESFQQQGG
jgi:hypothetical protein